MIGNNASYDTSGWETAKAVKEQTAVLKEIADLLKQMLQQKPHQVE